METKINYWKLGKLSRNLVNNKNFRNNQNYIISDFSKFKFYRTYYRTWFNKNIWKIIWYSFFLLLISSIFFKLLKEDFNIILPIEEIWIIWFILFVLMLIFIIFDNVFFYIYKKISYIFWKQKFSSNRYIFKKSPKSYYNRRDFISFKK
jgi:hypothetical protein